MGRITGWLAVWIVHLGLWLIYVSQVNVWEILVGSAAAAMATLGLAVFRRLGLVKCGPSLRQIAEIWRIPQCVISGTGQIMQGIGRQRFSREGANRHLLAISFDAGRDDAEGTGRRALAVLYTTMTPNFVVVGIVREQGLLLYHQLIPGKVPQMTQNLGARP